MKTTCELDDFFMRRLNLSHHEEGMPVEDEERPVQTQLGYTVERHKEDEKLFRFTLRVIVIDLGADNKPWGNSVDAEIVGFFRHGEQEMDAKQRAYFERMQGISILYGILRGVIATATGSFPHGKMMLPTIMPHDVIVEVEGKMAEQKKEKDKKAPSKSSKDKI